MKALLKHPQFLLVAFVAIALVACLAGYVPSGHEALALGMMPMMLGETTSIGDIADLVKKQGAAFEEFKRSNDELIKAKAEGKAVSDLEAKVGKINDDLSELGKQITDIAKKSNRPDPGAGDLTADQAEHKSAFREAFLRKGDDAGLKDLERKAFQRGSDVDGGYLIDSEMEASIDRVAGTISTMRTLADVRTIGKEGLKFRVKTSGLAARWVGEGEAGGESTNPKYAQLEILAEEMEVEPWAFNSALEDADFDVAADLMDEAGIGFGEAEGAAFISGTGVKKPRGILAYDTVADASYAWGKVGYIKSGASGAFAASNPGDNIIDLIHSLKASYRTGATLLMADTTLAAVRKIKDGSGNFYLFNPDPTGKFAGLVLGVPVEIDDNMPVLNTNSLSIAYANFQRAYRIVDRKGIALIRDNLTTKGTTKFNFRKRVGGGIKNFEAIKLMKFAA